MGDHFNTSGESYSPDGHTSQEPAGEALAVQSADGDTSRERHPRLTEGDGSDGQEEAGFGQAFSPNRGPTHVQTSDGAGCLAVPGNHHSPSARSGSNKSEENDHLFSPVRTLKFGEMEDSASYVGSDIRLGGTGVEDSGFVSQLSRGMDRGDGAYADSQPPSLLSSMRIVEGHVSPPADYLGARMSAGFAFQENSSTKDEEFVPLESDEESLQNGQNLYDSLERDHRDDAEMEEREPMQNVSFPRGLDALNRSLQSDKSSHQPVQHHGYPGSDGFPSGAGNFDHGHRLDGWTDHWPGQEVDYSRGWDAFGQNFRAESQSNSRQQFGQHLSLEGHREFELSEHHSLPQAGGQQQDSLGRQRSNSTGSAAHNLKSPGQDGSGVWTYSSPSPTVQGTAAPPNTAASPQPSQRIPFVPGGEFSSSPRGCGSGSAEVSSPLRQTLQMGTRPTVHDGDGASSEVAAAVSVWIPQMSPNLSNSALGADSQSFGGTPDTEAEQQGSLQQSREHAATSNSGKNSQGAEKGGNEGEAVGDADANANARIVGRAVPKLKGFGNGRDFKLKKGNDPDVCPRLSRTQQRIDQLQAQQHAAGHPRPSSHAVPTGPPSRQASVPHTSGMQRSSSQPISTGQQRQPPHQPGPGRSFTASAAHSQKSGSGATHPKVPGHQRDRTGSEHKAAWTESLPQEGAQGAGAREAAGGGGGGRRGGEVAKPSLSQETVVLNRHVPGTSLPSGSLGGDRFAQPPSPRAPAPPHFSHAEFSPPRVRDPVPGSRTEGGQDQAGGGNQGQQTAGNSMWRNRLHSPSDHEEILQTFSGIDSDLQGMENVRSHLQQMLSLSQVSPRGNKRNHDVSSSVSDLLLDQHQSPRSAAMGGVEDVLLNRSAPMPVDDDVSELFENFPNFSSKLFSNRPEPPRQDTSMHGEYQYLQRCLEKERFRRKHCEDQIQQLNAKLLEVQEQLAVAVSTDKRKDIMIEQLDKQLAKVVEGWKQREADKDTYLRKLLNEKEIMQERYERQEKTLSDIEREMGDVVQQLREEKDRSSTAINNAKMQLAERSREKSRAEELLAAERERATLIQQEWEQLKESRDLAERRADQIQERLHMEQDDWYRREQELIQQMESFKESNLKMLQLEKAKVEEARKKKEDLEERLEEAQAVIRKLELDMDSLARQKESMKVEMAILEAKHESAQRKLESDLQVQMEKEVSEQAAKHLKEMENTREELQERHKQAVNDIHRRHQRDLDKQLQKFRDDAQIREEDFRAQIRELEEKLQQYRDENTGLKHGKQKLESQRMEVLNKLQFIMQSQWNETVSLLANSPQKKDLTQNSLHASTSLLHNSSAVSQLSGAGPSGSNHLNFSFTSQSETGVSTFHNEPPAPPPPSTQAPLPHPHPALSQSSSVMPPLPLLQSSNLMGASASPSRSTYLMGSSAPSSQSNELPGTSVPPSQSVSSVQQLQMQEEQSRLHNYLRELKDLQGKYAHGVEGSSATLMPQDTNCSNPRAPPDPRESTPTPPPAHPLHLPPPPSLGQSRSEGQAMSAQEISFSEQLLAFLNTSNLPVNVHGYLLSQSNASNNQSFMSEATLPPGPPGHPPSHPPTAIMIRPPVQQSHVGGSGHPQAPHPRGPPSPRKKPARGRALRRPVSEDDGSDSWEDDDDDDGEELVHPFRSYGQSPPVKQGRHDLPVDRAISQTESEAGSVDIADLSGVLEESVHKISKRVELHESRQTELQKYIKMLLEKPPGSPMEGEGAGDMYGESDIIETSRDLTGEFDLNDTAQAAQLHQELSRLQQLRESQQQAGRSVSSELPERDQSKRTSASRPQGGMEGMAGVLQPQQLAEISQLLELVRLQQSQGQVQPGVDEPAAAQFHNTSTRNGGPAGARSSPKGSPKKQSQRSRDSSLHNRTGVTKGSALARDVPARPETGADNSRQLKVAGGRKPERKLAAVKPTQTKAKVSKSSSAWK